MLLVIAFLIIGIILGFIIRKKKKLTSKIDKAINFSIYLLLFTLGLKAGSDDAIVSRLHSLGFTALIISLFTITGSVLLAWLTYWLFFKKEKK
jgi:uncharacterized membrane protein YbjE (DUF340 family)